VRSRPADQHEANDSELAERFDVQGVGIHDRRGVASVFGPPELERTRTDADQGIGLVGADRRLPELISAAAVEVEDLRSARIVLAAAALALEVVPLVRDRSGQAGRDPDDHDRKQRAACRDGRRQARYSQHSMWRSSPGSRTMSHNVTTRITVPSVPIAGLAAGLAMALRPRSA
jgi:hypothetical protein